MANLVEKSKLRKFVPPSALNHENFEELAGKSYLEDVAAGQTIFRAGEADRKVIYLVEGEVELSSETGDVTTVRAGSDLARHALANYQPRKHTAKAKSPSKITRIDSDLLDVLMTWDQLSGIEVDEITVRGDDELDEEDWMMRILQSKVFLQIPPANIQAMFMRMQEVPVKAGQTIINQGEDGDYYYIIKSGKCRVTRSSNSDTELTLATLDDGDAFGEEALLSEDKRNANITMITDGVLMRLSKEDFNELLKEPMLNWVTREQAEGMVTEGAVWLDVRLEDEYEYNGLTGSINLPLFTLRLKANTLDPNKKYILYCDTGMRSSAGAFLLSERGLNAYCLHGGLSGVA